MSATITPQEGLRLYLERLRALGLETLYLTPNARERLAHLTSKRPVRRKRKELTPEEVALRNEQKQRLQTLSQELRDCRLCKLCETRTQVVFGVGSPEADIVFVGEGPGADEDKQGIPFVGKAGQLLTKMIQAMGLEREEVYICNVVKCRPPENRNPAPDEIASCEPFLIQQLERIQPQVIVALGKFAAQTLLRTDTPISRLRGQWRDYRGIPLMPTFHPSYLLHAKGEQQKREKQKVWSDLQQVMELLGLR